LVLILQPCFGELAADALGQKHDDAGVFARLPLSCSLSFSGHYPQNVLQNQIFKQVDILIGIGATVPLGEAATVDQKQLLTEMRNTKLLEAVSQSRLE
jgi:hypothetical protein